MRYLRELVTARANPVRDVTGHEATIWAHDLPDGVTLATGAGPGDPVLRVRRVALPEAPLPPVAVAPFVRGDVQNSAIEPALAGDRGDLRSTFDPWLVKWRTWATADRRLRPLWDLHQQLQAMARELSARPESVELVLGSGLLTLSEQIAEQDVRVHMVTAPVQLERDERNGDLLVRLDPERGLQLEDTQLLTGIEVFDSSESLELATRLGATVPSPIAPEVADFLKNWASRVLRVHVATGEAIADAATLTVSPALVLRRRSSFALLDYYDRIIAGAQDPAAPVPLGLAQLVQTIEPAQRLAWLERAGAVPAVDLVDDPLFPLPANDEQRNILDRLGGDSGVVVEGPPGTGKTHTIANIVSALLAEGQRVLVTSEKAQALRVLRDMLPAELQQLCVSVTDSARDGSAELNRSVAEIAARKASFSRERALERIAELAQRRDRVREARDDLTDEISGTRAAEVFEHDEVAPGYCGTAAQIVRQVLAAAPESDWLPGPLYELEPPIGVDEFRLVVTRLQVGAPDSDRRRYQLFPDAHELLPTADTVAALCRRARTAPPATNPEAGRIVELLANADRDQVTAVQASCERLGAAAVEVNRLHSVVREAADDRLSGRTGHLWSKAKTIEELSAAAAESDRAVGEHKVDVEFGGPRAIVACEILAAALAKGTVEWRPRFRKSAEQRAVEALGPVPTVDGSPAATSAALRVVVEHLRALDNVAAAADRLAELGLMFTPAGSRSQQVNALDSALDDLHAINSLTVAVCEFEAVTRRVDQSAPRIRSVATARAIAEAAPAIAIQADAERSRERLSGIRARLDEAFADGPSPESDALLDAVSRGDHDGIVTALRALAVAGKQKQELERFRELRSELESTAPALYRALVAAPADPAWAERVDQLPAAWAWRRAADWVREQSEPDLDRQLEAGLVAADAELAQLTAKLAAEQAWLECMERLTMEQMSALQAYRDHVSSIGRGTGRYAERYRLAARAAMATAQGAVPAWVMPLQQVLADIPPEPNSFDVVIVDEASQAEVAAVFLLWLAPRVIVVGDDKQCAPSEISSGELAPIFERLDLYLPDIPSYLRDGLTPRSSLFSLLRSRFGQVVRLREHFRCMPEIIDWSSTQFYRDAPLVPVRQFGTDRLPPLRTTHVPDGMAEGRTAGLVNRAEARALVDQVLACLDDPEYDDRTFGVVVLQGQQQVAIIRSMLTDAVDDEIWTQRRLRVGTPPDFQGDERNVVFLSMVVAPNRKTVALTRNEHQRAFNVAASRAQDQLWLFHSVSRAELAETDLRSSLLTYLQARVPIPAAPMPVIDRPEVKQPDFDTMFEQQVFLDLVERGYHVNPQVELNNRRIDLVVTGGAGRLAVECDGETAVEPPAQQRRELEREHELRRCGWEFWRIRESEYCLDPAATMQRLCAALTARGIEPGVVTATAGSHALAWEPVPLSDDLYEADPAADAEPEASAAAAPVPGEPGAPTGARTQRVAPQLGWGRSYNQDHNQDVELAGAGLI
ncbi:AAA domain-containing protein [Skermania piniformis]|nr:AAA domain-containing protein [Skermania piniformis]